MRRPPTFVVFYFLLIAGITAGMGLSLLFSPKVMYLFFDQLDAPLLFLTRIIGSTLIGYAVLNYAACRYYKEQHVMQMVAIANLVTLAVATVLCVFARSIVDHNLWLLIGQHAVFGLGFVYCLISIRGELRLEANKSK